MRHSPYGTIGMCLVIQGKVVDIEQENQTGPEWRPVRKPGGMLSENC
jgi:hypothetical protein